MEDENDIQAEHADFEMSEDPVIYATAEEAAPAAERTSPEPEAATAEVDPEAELAEFQHTHRQNVPWWTAEPDFDEWFDSDNPKRSLAEDTQRKIELGNSFAEKFRSEYSGAKLQWAERIFAKYANWWKKKKAINPVALRTN